MSSLRAVEKNEDFQALLLVDLMAQDILFLVLVLGIYLLPSFHGI